jgi:hypothetical protein
MKEYKLVSLPDRIQSFDKIVFRRILSDLSHRYLTFAELVNSSGLKRQEIRKFLLALQAQGLLQERDCELEFSSPPAFWDSLLQPPSWLRRALTITPDPF